ncbi:MAG TPA: C40 family peptidase [Steroidobacteraceae bacterium]
MGHDIGCSKNSLRACVVLASLLLGACAGAPRTPPTGSSIIVPSAPAATASAADARIQMVDSATAMIGQPYRWGGAAPGGFDCSGLVYYAAAGAGLRLPRTAREQEDFGAPVARTQVRAGDLVFMHLKRKELHVGIALDGTRFIHAPSSGGHVRIDSLNAPPYAEGFIGARRVIEKR